MRKPPEVYAPPPVSKAVALAIKALSTGTANESQQKRALEWIVRDAAKTHDLSFRPGAADATSFAEGKRFVGLQIIKVAEMKNKSVESLNG